ncbi:2'-5' RNA ligase family protein [Pedobacter psychrodurus]|uniref:2'-5' RNA ligase family protein n=1 Tax=Pedobacter psychrodurus TaxID=2530456 RepID=A0A4R0PRU4_9SPHI|nr:2'-5' RNA ligase family protein [Pedobacter psychrodurus]TCD21777.1 2'-5' RNA ligase family protein [Pedobacter psychrodurus]
MENLFLVCLVPPVSITEDIDEIRTYISEKFNVHESLKRPAHITLYPPVKLSAYEAEKSFFKALTDASFSQPFIQVLRNFNSFPEHTFYLDVEQNEGLMTLEKQISKALQPLKLLEKKEKFNPHLTLAFRDVKPPIFKQIATEFKDRKFKREFSVSSFSVYKHMDKKWQPFKEFSFKNPDTKPKALSLFG